MLRWLVSLACAVLLLIGVAVQPAAAQTSDKRTLFTFSGPVAMPGVTLPAGQYLFRLADPVSDRKIIQVLSGDGKTPYGLFFTITAERLEPAQNPEVRFMETAAGMPAAIKTWWYPGERTGYEFIYPKDQARKLAQGASQPVLTTKAETTTTAETNTTELARVSSTGPETAVNANDKPTPAAPAGTAQEGTVASASIQVPSVTVPAAAAGGSSQTGAVSTAGKRARSARSARTRLPQTASLQPVAALTGVAALGAALILWAWRRGWTPQAVVSRQRD